MTYFNNSVTRLSLNLEGGPGGVRLTGRGGGPKDKTNWSGFAFSAIEPSAKIYRIGNLSSDPPLICRPGGCQLSRVLRENEEED